MGIVSIRVCNSISLWFLVIKLSVLCHKQCLFHVIVLESVKIRIYGVLLLIPFELKFLYCRGKNILHNLKLKFCYILFF